MTFDLSKVNKDGRVFYPCLPIANAHPDRLATVAGLYGLETPARVDGCRILELGCADGGNLLPMAEALPNCEFLGIDLSEFEISAASKLADDLGLTNIQFKVADIQEIDLSYGEFDYILCHGVFSWVPTSVQTTILDICGQCLSVNGVAYINYNTFSWLAPAKRDS